MSTFDTSHHIQHYPTPASATRDGLPPSLQLASRGSRLAASLIDFLLILGVMSLGTIGLAGGTSGAVALSKNFSEQHAFASSAVAVALYLLLHGYWLARDGQTLGKRLCRIRVVRSDGSRASFARLVLLRYLPLTLVSLLEIPYLSAGLPLADALLVFRGSRQCLHDQLADTVVVTV